MYNIKIFNKISDKIFNILKNGYNVSSSIDSPDAILLRSFDLHSQYPLEIPPSLLAVARAGVGVNNIPTPRFSEKGIVVFNTPGANANAVKELVICSMFLATRNILEGIDWVKTIKDMGNSIPSLVEKGKNSFAGNELYGKTLGIVGMGAIGAMVANSCDSLGMNIIGFDPYLTDTAKEILKCSVNFVSNINYLYKNSDFVSYHIPLLEQTKGMLDEKAIDFMKDGVIIINSSRAEIAIVEDVLKGIESKKIRKYVVDFPTAEIIDKKEIITIPHLGASTEESEENCATMAAEQLKEYLENGNIKNSVNFPNINIQRCGSLRITVAYTPHSKAIDFLRNYQKTGSLFYAENNNLGYAIIDFDELPNNLIENLNRIEGVLRTRVL